MNENNQLFNIGDIVFVKKEMEDVKSPRRKKLYKIDSIDFTSSVIYYSIREIFPNPSMYNVVTMTSQDIFLFRENGTPEHKSMMISIMMTLEGLKNDKNKIQKIKEGFGYKTPYISVDKSSSMSYNGFRNDDSDDREVKYGYSENLPQLLTEVDDLMDLSQFFHDSSFIEKVKVIQEKIKLIIQTEVFASYEVDELLDYINVISKVEKLFPDDDYSDDVEEIHSILEKITKG